ncbi:acetoacetate decarboxylase [Bacillus fungorum]|uniref:Acetoacetate decarboxylase n=1 Tax=Bacillus fungorum TaxID=2039284 RepID=A0A2G6Q657_9BACI|nr:acetoacetate decarboxylase family protein [Bacillus fungorum]PIE91909.1 acetoacetate decarboxylase [Bacillus fungorum]
MFKFNENKTYLMPPWFGGLAFDPNYSYRINDLVSITFTFTTDGNRLANYLPKGFELLTPELTISYQQLRQVEFLFGGSYNLISIQVPVRFHGKRDQLEGSFPLVIWENNTIPIIAGREQTGMPKIYADIQDLHIPSHKKYFTNASFLGNTFLQLEMVQTQPIRGQQLEQIKAGNVNQSVLGWRYIPKVGAPGAELSQPVLYPQSIHVKNAWEGKGNVQWAKLGREYTNKEVISYYNIIKQLAELPVYNSGPAIMIQGVGFLKPYAGRVLM